MENQNKDIDKRNTKEKNIRNIVSFIASQIFFIIVLIGIVLYIIAQYKMKTFQPFEMATVIGVLGGFPLVAGYIDKNENETSKNLKTIGGIYILAAIFFTVFGFYQAADQASLFPQNGGGLWLFRTIYIVTFYGGSVFFVIAMWWTLQTIPMLIGLNTIFKKFKKTIKEYFK